MDTLHLRVSASFGPIKNVRGIPTAERSEVFTIAEGVVNDPYEPRPDDDDTVDDLLAAFEAEHGCKVSYPAAGNCGGVREFEIFEPTYPDADAARNAASTLLDRLTDYAQGRPWAKCQPTE